MIAAARTRTMRVSLLLLLLPGVTVTSALTPAEYNNIPGHVCRQNTLTPQVIAVISHRQPCHTYIHATCVEGLVATRRRVYRTCYKVSEALAPLGSLGFLRLLGYSCEGIRFIVYRKGGEGAFPRACTCLFARHIRPLCS